MSLKILRDINTFFCVKNEIDKSISEKKEPIHKSNVKKIFL